MFALVLVEMSKKDFECCVCQKKFSAGYNLRKHARKYHAEQVNVIFPKKTYNYQCTQCHRQFSLLKNFNYHKKRHNNQTLSSDVSPASKHTDAECPICKLAAPKKNLITHFEVEHDIKFVTRTIEFTSFEEFSTWKTDMEHDTKSKYVTERGFECTKDGTRKIKYCCHRSGKYVPSGKGSRHLKAQGSNKIGGFCPARLKVIINKNKQCKVSFTDQHVGHDGDDLRHLYLSLQERKTLANKMAQKIPFTQILDDIRDSVVGSQLERLHLVKRKDLSNIERSFNLRSAVVHHENNAVSEDDLVEQQESSDERDLLISEEPNVSEVSGIVTHLISNESANTRDVDVNQLATKKQKLIENFTQLMESVTNMEQLDVVEKMCDSLRSTLEAIATKQQLPGKPCTPIRSLSPSNKKIAPQRGNLKTTKTTKKKTSKAVAPATPTNDEMQQLS